MSKIGVFVCHCGENISATVDCEKVAAEASKITGVEVSVDYKYMCSDPGQTIIKDAIKEKGLIVDDRPEWCEIVYLEQIKCKRGDEKVIVDITDN